MGRRKPPSEVYNEWQALTFPTAALTIAERLSLWQQLDARCWCDGSWLVPIEYAELATKAGLYIYYRLARFEEMLELCARFSSHPEATSVDSSTTDVVLEHKAMAEILLGRWTEGVTTLRLLLKSGEKRSSSGRRLAAAVVGQLVNEFQPSSQVPPEMREFAVELLRACRAPQKALNPPEDLSFPNLSMVVHRYCK